VLIDLSIGYQNDNGHMDAWKEPWTVRDQERRVQVQVLTKTRILENKPPVTETATLIE
jgi:hypothetical protein